MDRRGIIFCRHGLCPREEPDGIDVTHGSFIRARSLG